MPSLRHLMRRLALSETVRDRLAQATAGVLVAVIVVCVVIVILALPEKVRRTRDPPIRLLGLPLPRRAWPAVYYKNCAEAHADDGRWNIPEGDPAYRPALDKDHQRGGMRVPRAVTASTTCV